MIYFKNSDLYRNSEKYEGFTVQWGPEEEYQANYFCNYNGNLYRSTQNNNKGNLPGSSSAWDIYELNDINDKVKDYELSITATNVTTLEHNEDTQELILFSRTYQDEIILPDTIVLDSSTVTVEVDSDYSFLTNNILPVKDDILYSQSTISGSFIISHNLDINDYFVIAKDNSKVQGQLLLVDVLEQTNNSCLISTNESYQDINMYFLSEKSFNKTSKAYESVVSGFSSITRHNMGNSDLFVWAIDESNNRRVEIPSVDKIGERYAELGFQDNSSYLVYFGGVSRESVTQNADDPSTAILLDDGSSEWKLSIDPSGSMLFNKM